MHAHTHACACMLQVRDGTHDREECELMEVDDEGAPYACMHHTTRIHELMEVDDEGAPYAYVM